MPRLRSARFLLIVSALAVSGLIATSVLSSPSVQAADAKPQKSDSQPPARLLIHSGTLISRNGSPIQLHAFEADIADGTGKQNEHLGNKIVLIKTGDAFLSNESLSRLLNEKLQGRSLEDIKVTTEQGQVKITGKARKAISVPFTIEGPVTLTNQGYIRLETKTVKVAKLPKGIAELLGMDPEKLAGDGKVKGVSADKNSISFDPDLLWGLPVHGQVTRLRVEKNGLLLIFGGQKQRPGVRLQARNAAKH